MKKLSIILGTRPEAIKLAPIILAAKQSPSFEVSVCVTEQHRELLDQVLGDFDIQPDVDLHLMESNQQLADFTARAITMLDAYFLDYQPDIALVQGDTSSVFAASLAAFYHRIKIGHVEAGLRTWNKYSPFPEEINRVLVTHLADYHFAPTQQSKENLLMEGIPENRIFVTGNTVIDALLIAVEKVRSHRPVISGLPSDLLAGNSKKSLVLITGHRRENFGEGFESICRAILTLADRFPDAAFVYPVHLNPNVREPVFRLLGGRTNIHLLEPLSYLPFVALMIRSTIILTDSGGIQEEALSLGKPVFVMREVTERPEALAVGTVRLVGADAGKIVASVATLLSKPEECAAISQRHNPYGDGQAAERILKILSENQ